MSMLSFQRNRFCFVLAVAVLFVLVVPGRAQGDYAISGSEEVVSMLVKESGVMAAGINNKMDSTDNDCICAHNANIHPHNHSVSKESYATSDRAQEHIKNQADFLPQADPDITGYPVSRYVLDRRKIDPVNTIRKEHTNSNPLGVSASEWKARTELAAAYRALYVMGLERSMLGSDQAAQCLMLRLTSDDEEETDHGEIEFLMADWGIWFEEVTASNLLKFTSTGELIHPDGSREAGQPDVANIGCIPVAKAIFESRSDVNMIVHIHPYAVMAVSGTQHGLLPLSQAAFFLWGQISREEYDFSYESNFEETLQGGFARGERAMLLNHHGMYAVGRDVAEGLFVATHLTQACEVQVRTLSMVGGDLSRVILPDGKELSSQYRDMMDSTDYSYDGSREWPGIVRKVQRQAPDFNL